MDLSIGPYSSLRNLLKGAKGQFIDTNGKTIMLHYNELTIFTSPLPPIRNLPISNKVNIVKDDTLYDFVKEHDLKIVSQTSLGNGVFVSSNDIYYGFIPTKIPLKGIPVEEGYVTGISESPSELNKFTNIRLLASILRQYSIYTYFLDPNNFSEDSFVIIPNYVYSIYKIPSNITINDIMFRNNKLVVPSKSVMNNLIKYVHTAKSTYDGTVSLQGRYSSLDKFRSVPGNVLFPSLRSLTHYMSSETKRFSDVLIPDILEPYFYKNVNIAANAPCIIQNVRKGNKKVALAVSLKWIRDRANIGPYITRGVVPRTYTVYTNEGIIESIDKGTDIAHILRYDTGEYAALLFV